jgi:hypothetical protein
MTIVQIGGVSCNEIEGRAFSTNSKILCATPPLAEGTYEVTILVPGSTGYMESSCAEEFGCNVIVEKASTPILTTLRPLTSYPWSVIDVKGKF